MNHAVVFAETGHLCCVPCMPTTPTRRSTGSSTSSAGAPQSGVDGSLLNLKAIIAQQLIPTPDGKGRAAIEVMINSPLAADIIRKGEVHKLKELMTKSPGSWECRRLIKLYDLYSAGDITMKTPWLTQILPTICADDQTGQRNRRQCDWAPPLKSDD